MMQGVKEQKVNHMKNIKKLTAEKAQLNDRFKTVKDANGTLKAAIDAAMKRYQSLPPSLPSAHAQPSPSSLRHAPRPRSLSLACALRRYQSLQAQYNTLGAALKANAEEDAVNKATLSEEGYARARTKTALVAAETGAQAEKIATEMVPTHATRFPLSHLLFRYFVCRLPPAAGLTRDLSLPCPSLPCRAV